MQIQADIGQLPILCTWPKKRTYKRRLTYREFLRGYREAMGENAEIFFKTDNRGLFEPRFE